MRSTLVLSACAAAGVTIESGGQREQRGTGEAYQREAFHVVCLCVAEGIG